MAFAPVSPRLSPKLATPTAQSISRFSAIFLLWLQILLYFRAAQPCLAAAEPECRTVSSFKAVPVYYAISKTAETLPLYGALVSVIASFSLLGGQRAREDRSDLPLYPGALRHLWSIPWPAVMVPVHPWFCLPNDRFNFRNVVY